MNFLPTLRRALVAACCVAAIHLAASASALAAELYQEPYRPQIHFTPASRWMNDPNGMVYYAGEYHLFYQFNPFGDKWGHMSWGHAVSRDLVRWEHLPVALYEADNVMIFSGSAVVDWNNTSGFGQNGTPPLVAIYTGHHTDKPLQNQQLAFSNDRGRTWAKYPGNPVLDIGEKDFRDPKVFWHSPSKRWVMTVAWPIPRKVRFYSSPNLKDWTHLSDFGPAGSTDGIWECPDLFSLRVDGAGREEKWVLIVNVGSGAPAGGSGCQYFVGDFDGSRFTLDPSFPKPHPGAGAQPADSSARTPNQPTLWADFGPDFYAAVSWSDIPARDGRRLWLGWMSNWQYANDVPTSPWRSAMSLPRELLLRRGSEGLRLAQRPVRELRRLRGQRQRLTHAGLADANQWLQKRQVTGGLWEIEAELDAPAGGEIEIELLRGTDQATVLRLNPDQRALSLDRTRSGRTDFHPKFKGVYSAPLPPSERTVRVHVFVDTSSVEVFAGHGESVITALVLPETSDLPVQFKSSTDSQRIRSLNLWKLKPAVPIPTLGAGSP